MSKINRKKRSIKIKMKHKRRAKAKALSKKVENIKDASAKARMLDKIRRIKKGLNK